MNKDISEVDLIVHYMRQSKMDAVRRELEMISKDRATSKGTRRTAAHMKLLAIKELFQAASNNAPLP